MSDTNIFIKSDKYTSEKENSDNNSKEITKLEKRLETMKKLFDSDEDTETNKENNTTLTQTNTEINTDKKINNLVKKINKYGRPEDAPLMLNKALQRLRTKEDELVDEKSKVIALEEIIEEQKHEIKRLNQIIGDLNKYKKIDDKFKKEYFSSYTLNPN